MDQRMVKSVLKGAENSVARAKLVVQWSFLDHYELALDSCVESGQLRNNYHRYNRQDMDFLRPRSPVLSRDVTVLSTELIE